MGAKWAHQTVSRLEETKWLGRRGREPDQDPPSDHADSFEDYSPSGYGVRVEGAGLSGTGADRKEAA